MIIARFAYPTIFFVSGLGVGVLWNPICSTLQMQSNSRAVSVVQSENQKFVAKMRETYGVEMAEFVKQFEDMTIHIKINPIDVWASPDNRFVIRLVGSDESIVSDLRYPDKGGAVKELVRHYSFSCDNQSFSCDFGRNIENPKKITEVQFHFTDNNGHELSYVDSDADGRWDKFIDYTQESPKFYKREGLCWKESMIEAPKEPDQVPNPPAAEKKTDFQGEKERTDNSE